MIRIIPCFKSGEFNPLGIRYLPTDHYSLFRAIDNTLSSKLFGEDLPLHMRTDYFNKEKKPIGQDIICLDFDLKEKNIDRQVFGDEENKLLSDTLSILGIENSSTSTVFTGYGMHLFIFFDEIFKPTDELWLKGLAQLLNKGSGKYEVDTGSFINFKTIRVPASLYKKHSKTREYLNERVEAHTEIYSRPTTKSSFSSLRNKFIHLAPKKKKKQEGRDLKNIYNWKEMDVNAILDIGAGKSGWGGCRFLRFSLERPNEMNYHEWLSSITLLSKLYKDENASYDFAKQFSQGYQGFNEEEFGIKFKEARHNMYPSSCENVAATWRYGADKNMGCATCPHRKTNLPLNITFYPNKENGFRIMVRLKDGGSRPTGIDFESLVKYFNKELKIRAEKDETVYKYNGDFYEEYPLNVLISENKSLIYPQIKPNEIDAVKKYVKHTNIFDIENTQKKQRNLIFFRNGIYDIKKDSLFDKNPDLINTYCLDFDYIDNRETPLFDDLLEFAFSGNKQNQDFFMKFCASAIFEERHMEKALLLVGDGANGKSTLMNAVASLFPTEARVFIPFDPMNIQRDETYIGHLRRGKIAYCSDISPLSFSKNLNIIKRIVSGEEMSFRNKYARQAVNFRPKVKLIFSMNEMPVFNESTIGLKRRFETILFENSLDKKNVDIHLGKKLLMERVGIFHKLLESYKSIGKYNIGTTDSTIIEESIEIYDAKEAWFNERIDFGGAERVYGEDIFKSFCNYLIEQGEDPLRVKITQRALSHWFSRKSKRQCEKGRDRRSIYFTGVRIYKNSKDKSHLQVMAND